MKKIVILALLLAGCCGCQSTKKTDIISIIDSQSLKNQPNYPQSGISGRGENGWNLESDPIPQGPVNSTHIDLYQMGWQDALDNIKHHLEYR